MNTLIDPAELEPVEGLDNLQEKEKKPFKPTFPNAPINMETLTEGLMWGECRLPLTFDLNAVLPPGRAGQAELLGDHVKISIDAGVPAEFRHIVAYHELIEAEGLSNGYVDGSSHAIACEMEERYINTFLSESEKKEYISLMGSPGELYVPTENSSQSDQGLEANQALEESFTAMQGWQNEMKRDPAFATEQFYGSKKIFLENCRKLYPNELASINLQTPGFEIAQSRRKLEEKEGIPDLKNRLEAMAHNTNVAEVQDPVELIREIDRLVEPSSEVLEAWLIKHPGQKELQGELDECFRQIYRLELLRGELVGRLSPEQQKALQSGSKETEAPVDRMLPGETEDEYEHRVIAKLNEKWRLMLEQDLGPVDEWFKNDFPGELNFQKFSGNFKTGETSGEQWQRLTSKLMEFKNTYHQDPRPPYQKDFIYKRELAKILEAF